MDTRGAAGRLISGLAVVALLGGCAAGTSPSPAPMSQSPSNAVASPGPSATPKATATPSTTLSPAPSTTPAAVAYGPVTVVTGTGACPGLNPVWTTDPDGTRHVRNLPVECIEQNNDPRVSGTHTAAWNMDLWAGAAGVQWGTARLENAGGTWEGRLSGAYSSARGDIIAIWYKGTGGYTGLSYFELWTGTGPWVIQGQIFPGELPPP